MSNLKVIKLALHICRTTVLEKEMGLTLRRFIPWFSNAIKFIQLILQGETLCLLVFLISVVPLPQVVVFSLVRVHLPISILLYLLTVEVVTPLIVTLMPQVIIRLSLPSNSNINDVSVNSNSSTTTTINGLL